MSKFIHPELQDGEIWLCNMKEDVTLAKDGHDGFDDLPHKTKRAGEQAFYNNGEPINDDDGWFPVFVKADDKHIGYPLI